jgi:hypothetical protein
MFFAGYLGDKITLRLAKRRNGTHIPEDSLVSLIFPTIVCAIGIAVYAVAANDTEKYSSWGIVMGEFACFFYSFLSLGEEEEKKKGRRRRIRRRRRVDWMGWASTQEPDELVR